MNVDGILNRARKYLVLLLAVLLTVPAFAKKNKNDKPQNNSGTRIVGHIPLEGAAARQMFLQVQNGKQYLYIDQGAKQGFTVVDVTKAAQPAVVRHVDAGKLQMVGSGMAITATPEGETKTVARSHPPTEAVTVLDTSDPANPKALQTFSGVTSIVQDSGRNLVYLTNPDGLWVLSQGQPPLAPSRKKPPCSSEAAISAMPPDCD